MIQLREILGILFPYLIGLYAIEGIGYARQHHLVFRAWFGNRFRIVKPGFYLAAIFPTGSAPLANLFPACFTAKGIFVPSHTQWHENRPYDSDDFRFFAYREIESIAADGKSLAVNGEVICNYPSSAWASGAADFLRLLQQSPSEKRKGLIQNHIDRTLDLDLAMERMTVAAKALFYSRLFSMILFLFSFVLLPISLYTDMYRHLSVSGILLCMGITYALILISTAITIVKLYGTRKKRIAGILFFMVISPVSAMHAGLILSREKYVAFDWFAIAAVLLPPHTFTSTARKELFFVRQITNVVADDGWKLYWEYREKMCRKLIAGVCGAMTEVESEPIPKDETAEAYCPACTTEFTSLATTCPDCGASLEKYSRYSLTEPANNPRMK